MKRIPMIGQPHFRTPPAAANPPKHYTVLFGDRLHHPHQHRHPVRGLQVPAIIQMINSLIAPDKDIFLVIGIDIRCPFHLAVQISVPENRTPNNNARSPGRLSKIDHPHPLLTHKPEITIFVRLQVFPHSYRQRSAQKNRNEQTGPPPHHIQRRLFPCPPPPCPSQRRHSCSGSMAILL